MEELTVEESEFKVPAASHEAGFTRVSKKPYHKPELTKYQRLAEITLGIQCNSTVPPCSPAADPFA